MYCQHIFQDDNIGPGNGPEDWKWTEMHRRAWLDKLLSFMDGNKTPINMTPKNGGAFVLWGIPLDLYALYLHVREKGGFLEVSFQ